MGPKEVSGSLDNQTIERDFEWKKKNRKEKNFCMESERIIERGDNL